MKKIIDLAQIEAREKQLLEELADLRKLKRYADKFGFDYHGQATSTDPLALGASVVPQADAIGVVKNAISSIITETFTNQDIEKLLSDAGMSVSRSSIFEAISTFKDRGEIIVAEKGAGRRPAKYKKTDKFLPFEINISVA